MKAIPSCHDERRRALVREAAPRLNGIDYVDVGADRRELRVFFLNKLAGTELADALDKRHVRIEGGTRLQGLRVIDVEVRASDDPDRDDYLDVRVDRPGDFSPYTLRLVELDDNEEPKGPLAGVDPRYASIDFIFHPDCPRDVECKTAAAYPPRPEPAVEINYLAKDYASFRQLLLDRMATLIPDWRERHVPDLGIAILEVLAYVGDHLSYYQDAVATEAYLDTARRRISVRRHARLVDYRPHEGANARAWVSIAASANQELPIDELFFVAGLRHRIPAGVLSLDDFRGFNRREYEVFEPVRLPGLSHTFHIVRDHSQLEFYTWGDRECCLHAGATSATLKAPPAPSSPAPDSRSGASGAYQKEPPAPAPASVEPPKLQIGDVLILAEIVSPQTGNSADANPAHRHPVRLTRADYREDPAVLVANDPDRFQPIIEIAWGDEDALPFDLCLSGIVGPECRHESLSVAWGNVLLVDHGRTIDDEPLGSVPGSMTRGPCTCVGHRGDLRVEDGAFGPTLAEAPLTFSVPLPEAEPDRPVSALALVTSAIDPRGAEPQVRLASIPPRPWTVAPLFDADVVRSPNGLLDFLTSARTPDDGSLAYLRSMVRPDTLSALMDRSPGMRGDAELNRTLRQEILTAWTPRVDLLDSDANDAHFVVEIDDDAVARLRFGDGETGRRPRAGTAFLASYRVGNGPAGNVGPDTIAHLVLRRTVLSGVSLTPRNPLPATGGAAAEPTSDIRLLAPQAFRTELERAITAEDYGQLAARHPDVQRAAAEIRWTGSRQRVVVAVDQRGRAEASNALLTEIGRRLAIVRRIGHDVEVTRARYVSLDVALVVDADPDFIAEHVEAALRDQFGSGIRRDGQPGFFHPDRFSFGDSVHVSRLVAAAHDVAGVERVCVTRLDRQYEGQTSALEDGVLPIGALEIARLDSDPNFPDRGQLDIRVRGGR